MPDWLQEFRENVVDESSPSEPRGNPEPEVQDTSTSSHDLPMGARAKVEPSSGRHSIYTHFPKDPNCDICLRTKITRSSCRRRTGTVMPRAEHLWLDNSRLQKFSVNEVNRVTIIDTLWWYKIWQLSGYNTTHVKHKLLRHKQMGSQRVTSNRGAVAVRSGHGRIPWSVTAICETVNISCLMWKTPYERRFVKPLNGPVILFGAMVE